MAERAENRRADYEDHLVRDDHDGVARHLSDEPEKYSTRLDWETKRERHLSSIRIGWTKMREYLNERYEADPSPENRHAVGKMLMDVACCSKKEAVILKALGQFCKVYGHDEKTIVTQDATSKVERLRQWRDALAALSLKNADVIDGTVKPLALERVEERIADPSIELNREVNASLRGK